MTKEHIHKALALINKVKLGGPESLDVEEAFFLIDHKFGRVQGDKKKPYQLDILLKGREWSRIDAIAKNHPQYYQPALA